MTRPATVVIDLRVAQINGERGIPAYSQSLTLELARGYPRHRWLLLHDPHRPPPAQATELERHAAWCTVADFEGSRLPPVDVLFTACFFFVPHKGRTVDAIVPPVVQRHRPRRMGIVYDLIPLLFADRYLSNENARRTYFESLQVLRGSDHLFAISHATRHDTIRHAAMDPRRVHCIYGDIDHTKQSLMALPAGDTVGVPAQHGLTGPYCAYVGGDDWRKNLHMTVRAFAVFWRTHPAYQLAIVCKLPKERIAAIRRLAAEEGLPQRAVVCTGFVPDTELVGLVRHADMVVFPSLYEGLGLPVLEAYGCGTPVVGSNTSSIAELVLPELACDPRDPTMIAATMARLVAQPSLREASLALGRRLAAEELGWPRAAERVIERVEDGPQESLTGRSPLRDARSPETKPLPRIAVVTTSAPLEAIGRWHDDRWQATVYEVTADPGARIPTKKNKSRNVLPVEVLPAALLRGRHDAVIFVVGDVPWDSNVLDEVMRSRRTSGRRILWLHEAAMDAAFQCWLAASHGGLLPADATATGLRLLVERGELDAIVTDSVTCHARVRTALRLLGNTVPVELAAEPLDLTRVLSVTAPDTAAACSLGAA